MLHRLHGLTSWWTRLPAGGRAVLYLFSGGSIFGFFTLLFGVRSGLIMLAIILIAALIFFLIKVWAKRQEKKRSDAAQRVLLDGISRSEGSGVDESQEERDVRRRLEDRWKSVYSTLHERNYDYYSFPWYLIIGPAQSGKTTSIQKSDQEFPIGDKPVADYGGTRGCNWFFTNQAILIDTAGRYVEHLGGTASGDWNSMLARDQEEWNTFLDLLRSMRARSPINGVILTIKLADIVEAESKSRQRLVDTLRRALLDIEERLKIRVPVYILVTMCDKLVGFVDFFAHLPGLADRTLFGWSRPGDYARPIEAEEFPPAFAGLKDKLDRMLIEFMEEDAGRASGSSADLQRMDRLMSFPDEFATLGPHLQDILTRVFAPSAYNEHHYFRGVYFTSGLQEGRPVLSACRALVGDRAADIEEEDVADISPESKAFFIADLYAEKIFREAGLVKLTRRAHLEQRRKKIVYASVSAVIALAVTIWVLLSAHGVNKLSRDPRTALRDAIGAGPMLGSVAGDKRLLGGMEQLTAGLDRLEEEGSNLAGKAISDASDEVYRAYTMLFAKRVLQPLVLDLLRRAETPAQETALRSLGSVEKLNAALCYFHGLGAVTGPRDYRPREGDAEQGFAADPDGLFACLESIRKLHLSLLPSSDADESTVKPDYKRVLNLRPGLLEAIADREGEAALPAEILDVFRAATMRNRIEEVIDLRVVGFWQDYADRLDTRTATEPMAAPTGDPDLMRPWFWGELDRRSRAADEIVEKLTTPLSSLIQGSVRSLAQFDDKVKAPWSREYPRLESARQRILEHWNNNQGSYGTRTPDEFFGDKYKAFLVHRDSIEIVCGRTSENTGKLRTRIQDLNVRLETLQSRPRESWTNLRNAGERWSSPDALAGAGNLASLVLYTESRHAEFLKAENSKKFAIFKSEDGVEKVVKEVLSGSSFAPQPGSLPKSLNGLLESGSEALAGLGTRFRTLIYVDLITMLDDSDEDRVQAFRDAVLDYSQPAPDPKDARFSSANAVRLTEIVRHLLLGFESNRKSIWNEAGAVPEKLARNARNYLDAFEQYWSTGIQPGFETRREDLGAITKALVAGNPVELKRAWSRFGSLQTQLGSRVEFAGKQSGDFRLGPLNKVIERMGPRPIVLDLDPIHRFWLHYRRNENRDELKRVAGGIDKVFEHLSTAGSDLELYRRSTDESVRKALTAGTTLQAKWTELDLHPLLDTLEALGEPTIKALDALPTNLFTGKWDALLDRAERDDLKDKFPFLSAALPRENRGSLADWTKTREFLASDELAFLAEMVQEPVDKSIHPHQVTFLRACAELRRFLGLDRKNPDEPYTVEISIARARHQKGGTTSLLESNDWRAVFQVGEGVETTADFTLPVSQTPVGPFEWEPGRRLRFFIQCWDREKNEQGRWEPELPYRFAPDEPNWAGLLILALGGDSPDSPEPVEGARPVLLRFKHSGQDDRGSLVFWFKTGPNPLPSRLPDLEQVWDIGRK